MHSKHLKHLKHRLFRSTSPAWANEGSSARRARQQGVELADGEDLNGVEFAGNTELSGT
jgi:hypothetical protein